MYDSFIGSKDAEAIAIAGVGLQLWACLSAETSLFGSAGKLHPIDCLVSLVYK